MDTLYCGEVGYLAAQIKSVQDARVGDTVTMKKQPAAEALPGYQDIQPMVYCGLFPTDSDDYQVRRRTGCTGACMGRVTAGSLACCARLREQHGVHCAPCSRYWVQVTLRYCAVRCNLRLPRYGSE